MSRNIQNDHPWTTDEIQYKLDRHLYKEVEDNKRMFPPGSEKDESPSDAPELKLDQDIYDHVEGLEVPELKQELRSNGLQPKGDEVALKVALAKHLQEKRDAGNS